MHITSDTLLSHFSQLSHMWSGRCLIMQDFIVFSSLELYTLGINELTKPCNKHAFMYTKLTVRYSTSKEIYTYDNTMQADASLCVAKL